MMAGRKTLAAPLVDQFCYFGGREGKFTFCKQFFQNGKFFFQTFPSVRNGSCRQKEKLSKGLGRQSFSENVQVYTAMLAVQLFDELSGTGNTGLCFLADIVHSSRRVCKQVLASESTLVQEFQQIGRCHLRVGPEMGKQQFFCQGD